MTNEEKLQFMFQEIQALARKCKELGMPAVLYIQCDPEGVHLARFTILEERSAPLLRHIATLLRVRKNLDGGKETEDAPQGSSETEEPATPSRSVH